MQNPGQLRIHSHGIQCKKQGGGKAVEGDNPDVSGLTWMKVPMTNQLALRIKDSDFVAEKDDSGSPTDDSGEEGSDASETGEEPAKKKLKKEASSSKASSGRSKSKDGDGDGSKKRKQKKKKDPNAPKKAMSGFMFYSASQREIIKKNNPGIAFTDISKVIGEQWKK